MSKIITGCYTRFKHDCLLCHPDTVSWNLYICGRTQICVMAAHTLRLFCLPPSREGQERFEDLLAPECPSFRHAQSTASRQWLSATGAEQLHCGGT